MKIKEFIFDAPLYTKLTNEVEVEIEGEIVSTTIQNLIQEFDERVEMYCNQCNSVRIFASDQAIVQDYHPHNPHYRGQKIISLPSSYTAFRCSSNSSHIIHKGFLLAEGKMIKIAEFPSKYDLVRTNFNNYEKVLSNEKISELGKAAQLESFGYSIASLLYYRRIFESIIFESFNSMNIDNKISNEEFRSKRMDEKVNYVKEVLPKYFSENSHMYGILSKGIHELKEEECRDFLPVIKSIIYYSLDEAVEAKNKERRKIDLSKQLGAFNSKLKK